MRHLIAIASLSVLTACGGSEPAPPAHPQAPQPAADDPVAGGAAQMQAKEADAAAAKQAAYERELAGAKAAANKELAAIEAKKEAAKKACADSRERRVSAAKEAIIARMDAETRLLENAKAIRASCRLTERRTGAVNVSQGVAGVRVAPEVADDVTCGRLPKGVTKDDAYVVLARDREGIKRPTGPILGLDDLSADDRVCQAFDKEAGVDFGSPNFDNIDSVSVTRSW